MRWVSTLSTRPYSIKRYSWATQVKERKENETIWDLRRRAPAHFWARAENAYTCAKVLFDQEGETHNLALHEGFIRESSIALELILKALIAEQSNAAPPNSHDVFDLSNRANLPKLSSDDLMRLTEVTEVLYWSGRYAAPTSDANLKKGEERSKKYQSSKPIGSTVIISPTPYGWDEFEKLFRIVLNQNFELHAENRPD